MQLEHTAQHAGSLYQILRGEMHMSSSLVGRLKFENALLVNNRNVHTNYQVQTGDRILVLLHEPPPNYPPENEPLTILYEDDALLAVDKPAGLLIHPSPNRNTGTLANRLLGYYRATGQDSAVHPVTRLDRDTFGITLLAKNSHVHSLLCEQQRAGNFQKTYHALVAGQPATCNITAPIARSAPQSMLRCVRSDGKPAETALTLLTAGDRYSLVELQPVSGRTHQLRVHCAYIGHPILGDPQYASEESAAMSHALGLSFQQLCAKELHFMHPMSGAAIHLCSNFCLNLEKFVAYTEQPVYNEGNSPADNRSQTVLEEYINGYV